MEFKRLRKLRNYLEGAFLKNHIEAAIEAFEATNELENQGFLFDENDYREELNALRKEALVHAMPSYSINPKNTLWKNIDCLEGKFGFSAKEILGKLKENPNILTAADDLELLSKFTGLDEQACDKILTNAKNATATWQEDIKQSNLNYITQANDHNPPQLNIEAYKQPRTRSETRKYEEQRRFTLKNIDTFIELVESGKANPEDIDFWLVGFHTSRLVSDAVLPSDVLYNMMKANRDMLANISALKSLNRDKSRELDNFLDCAMLQCSPQALENISNNVQKSFEEKNQTYTSCFQTELAAAKAQEQSAEMQ